MYLLHREGHCPIAEQSHLIPKAAYLEPRWIALLAA